MTPLQRAGVLVGGILVLCCGGVTVIGAIGSTVDKPAADLSAADARSAADVPSPSSTPAGAPSPSPTTPSAAPAVEKRTVTETKKVPFKTRTVRDPNLQKGSKNTRTEGAAGERTLTYEITLTDGKQTAKRLLSNKVTRQPTTKVIVIGTMSEPEPESDCDPNYSGCVPVDSDVDCAGGSGNGPSYVSGVVKITGSDIYDLDRDNDGYGCD